MVRSIGRCLGVVVLLGPLAAMFAMIVWGVPQLAPTVLTPGWMSGAESTSPSVVSSIVTGGVGESGVVPEDVPSGVRRSKRPLPATSRRSRTDQPMASVGPSRTRATGSMTWSQVRAGLEARGIVQFKIQSGSRAGEVHFSCVQPVPGRVRVVRRFEAEASDPLRAARDVLLQIEQYDRRLLQVAGSR
jgi:hypothetical protein